MLHLTILCIVLFILVSVVVWSLKTGISPMFSSPGATRKLCALSSASGHEKIIDLGSGWGTLALAAARANPDKSVVGYELSPVPLYFSKLLKLLFRQRNLHFYRRDFFALPFESGALYLCYLYPGAMEKLADKLKNSAVKPALISSTFALPDTRPCETVVLRDLWESRIYRYSLN